MSTPSSATGHPPVAPPEPNRGTRRRGRSIHRGATSLLSDGESFVWLTGAALVFALMMILGLQTLVLIQGLDTFRPTPIVQWELHDGTRLLGEVTRDEDLLIEPEAMSQESKPMQASQLQALTAGNLDRDGLRRALLQQSERDQKLLQDVNAQQERLDQNLERSTDWTDRPTDTPAQRVHWVRTDRHFEQREELFRLRASLAGQQESLKAGAETSQAAIEFLAAAPTEQPLIEVLTNAPEPVRVALWQAILLSECERRGVSGLHENRRSLRTGNFELTNTHSHLVPQHQIAHESTPPHALVVERVAWGRCYGEARRFIQRHANSENEADRQWSRALEALQRHAAEIAPPDAASWDEAVRTLQQQRLQASQSAATRNRNTWQETHPPRPDVQWQLEYDSGPAVDWDETPTGQAVTALRQVSVGQQMAWDAFVQNHPRIRESFHLRQRLEKEELGEVNHVREESRLVVRQAEIDHGISLRELYAATVAAREQLAAVARERQEWDQIVAWLESYAQSPPALLAAVKPTPAALSESWLAREQQAREEEKAVEAKVLQHGPAVRDRVQQAVRVHEQANERADEIQRRIDELKQVETSCQLELVTSSGQEIIVPLGDIVRAYPANQLSTAQKWAVYASRWHEFLWDEPREANSEGGVFPAIWGTISMTLLMSMVVAPLGVMAAVYLREYARPGLLVSIVRISINNLAGVPSIVFGVFGLGFFCYMVGAYVDGGPDNANFTAWPSAQWWLAAMALAITGMVAFALSLWGMSRSATNRGYANLCGNGAFLLWLVCTGLLVLLIIKNPFFNGLYQAHLPNPTFGKGGMLWASLTLALLTLPVVIVATEEALAAVPNSVREGSYGCGASRWQTIRRIVLPQALPGIMTGMILAMARGAGEVAPLMLVGAVKLAPELAVDGNFPFLHGDRSFMHLGFHIFDIALQSQNSEAARPVVFTTTFVLIAIITALNATAIRLRSKLRKRFQMGQF